MTTSSAPIVVEARSILSEKEEEEIRVALVRTGKSLKDVARESDVSYSGLMKALNRSIRCHPRYAEIFNGLLEEAYA